MAKASFEYSAFRRSAGALQRLVNNFFGHVGNVAQNAQRVNPASIGAELEDVATAAQPTVWQWVQHTMTKRF
jgi:hypothetical protein